MQTHPSTNEDEEQLNRDDEPILRENYDNDKVTEPCWSCMGLARVLLAILCLVCTVCILPMAYANLSREFGKQYRSDYAKLVDRIYLTVYIIIILNNIVGFSSCLVKNSAMSIYHDTYIC